MLRSMVLLMFCASVASAETSDVPRLSDGSVDVGAVYSSFKVVSPLMNGAEATQFEGELLGKRFEASFAGEVSAAPFDLTIRTAMLSEEATFIVAVLLTDIICMNRNRGSAGVKWKDTAAKVGDQWRFKSSCSTDPKGSSLDGS